MKALTLVSSLLVYCATWVCSSGSNCTLSDVQLEKQKKLENALRQSTHNQVQRNIETPVFTQCPNGFVRHDDSCYIAAHDLANWPNAYVYCEAYGGHLAFVESEREQHFLAGYIHNLKGSTTDSHFYYWLGGTDAIFEGVWVWAKVVKPIKYTHWRSGEPNNDAGHASKHQDCLGIYGENGFWDDGWCETEHNFICEIEIDQVTNEIVG